MMKELKRGLFVLEEVMPCAPEKIGRHVAKYMIPNALGHAEHEEAAARILCPSIAEKQWVGVSWMYIVEQMRKEFDADRAIRNAQAHNFEEEHFVLRDRLTRYWLATVLTLGIYALFAEYPRPDFIAVPNADDLPFSIIPLYGPDAIIKSIWWLIEKSLVVEKACGDDKVLFPTPALVQAIGLA